MSAAENIKPALDITGTDGLAAIMVGVAEGPGILSPNHTSLIGMHDTVHSDETNSGGAMNRARVHTISIVSTGSTIRNRVKIETDCSQNGLPLAYRLTSKINIEAEGPEGQKGDPPAIIAKIPD